MKSWSTIACVLLAASPIRIEEGHSSPGPAVQESSSCARCHSNAPRASAMRDAGGSGVAPFDLWQGTMMANASRDPLWRAAVSVEVAATPSRREEIEATCLGCHAPMAEHVGLEEHGTGSLMHVLDCDAEIGDLGRDGVSCTICHGMSAEGLGTEASFSGGYVLDEERRLFGPHADPFAMPMRRHTGFTPTQGDHVTESALCGSCHTLSTPTLDVEGQEVGDRFLEQAPYLEWLNSDYRDEGEAGPRAASCQSCHLPTLDEEGRTIRTRIARNPGGRDFPPTRERSPFGRHAIVGGNTLVLSMLRDHAEELGVRAPTSAIQAAIDATREQLRGATASLTIEDVRLDGRTSSFQVAVQNRAGHKLPTAHPTRRAWIRVVVRDASGEVLFASGATDGRGRILGAEGEPLPSELAGGPIEPHRDVVRSADEISTYEAVMADTEGRPTHILLRGASWYVDDRLLPKGWSADHPDAHRTAPVGVGGDDDFGPGEDRVSFVVELEGEVASIEANLLYQSLSARWAAEILRWDTPEVETFRRLYERAVLEPEVLATARWRR